MRDFAKFINGETVQSPDLNPMEHLDDNFQNKL
jgi:hypothetical protein